MSFRSFEPISKDAPTDWAQKVHRAAFDQRKIVYGPDTLTSHTTRGVIQRMKPQIGSPSEPAPPPAVSTDFDFEVIWTLPNGGGSEDVEIQGATNMEPCALPDIFSSATRPPVTPILMVGHFWPQSGVRFTKQIRPGFLISGIFTSQNLYGDPSDEDIKSLRPNLTAAGDFFGFDDHPDAGQTAFVAGWQSPDLAFADLTGSLITVSELWLHSPDTTGGNIDFPQHQPIFALSASSDFGYVGDVNDLTYRDRRSRGFLPGTYLWLRGHVSYP